MNSKITPEDQKGDHKEKEVKNQLVIQYLTLRRWVGYLGIALPVVLVCLPYLITGCSGFQSSISDYHNTIARDVFVGLLCAISLFLFAYTGYTKLDNRLANITGILGFVVAFFPTSIEDTCCTIYPYVSWNEPQLDAHTSPKFEHKPLYLQGVRSYLVREGVQPSRHLILLVFRGFLILSRIVL